MDPVLIIPCLDIKGGRVVKGVHFVELRDVGDLVEAAYLYSKNGADEIAFLDITATVEGRRTMFNVVRRVAAVVDVPLTVGGGIKTCADIEEALASGAFRVSISSTAFRNPPMVREAVRQFGADRIVIAIDADVNERLPSRREVFIDGGRTATGKDVAAFAREMADLGAGWFLPTSKGTDGTQEGYDLVLTKAVSEATGRPVIASGGAGKLEHFAKAVLEGKASAILVASVFHFRTFSILEVKKYLLTCGINVRL